MSGEFTTAEEAWIEAIVAASPLTQPITKRAIAEQLCTIRIEMKGMRALAREHHLSQDDHKLLATQTRNYWEGWKMLHLTDAPKKSLADLLGNKGTQAAPALKPATGLDGVLGVRT